MFRFARLLYPLLYTAALVLYTPVFLYWAFSRGQKAFHLGQRLGRLPAALRGLPPKRQKRVWIQAVSVGEVNVVRPILHAMIQDGVEVFLSTSTETGQALARDSFGEQARVFFFPLDWEWVCRRYLRAIEPDLVLLIESEFWPAFVASANRCGVPAILINGRLSDRSFPRYVRLRWFFGPLLSQLECCCMQSRQDKQRVVELGVPESRVHHVGNLKYDYHLLEDPGKRRLVECVKTFLGTPEGNPVWLCGSTREGEEELLLPVFQRLKEEFPRLRWLVAPRHIHRSEEVERLVSSAGLDCLRRSRLVLSDDPAKLRVRPDVVILDTIGELAYLFELADLVFIGGSLVPWGGHNVIEAANFGKPILFGPHMQNFREVAQTFLDQYGALQATDAEDLFAKMQHLLRDPKAGKWLGQNARKVIRDNQGATQQTLQIIREYLEKGSDSFRNGEKEPG